MPTVNWKAENWSPLAPASLKSNRRQAATEPLIGVTTQIGSESNGRVDVIFSGITEVIAGGTIAKGAVLTSDGSGNVITATQAADRVIGIALEDALANDHISVLIAQG